MLNYPHPAAPAAHRKHSHTSLAPGSRVCGFAMWRGCPTRVHARETNSLTVNTWYAMLSMVMHSKIAYEAVSTVLMPHREYSMLPALQVGITNVRGEALSAVLMTCRDRNTLKMVWPGCFATSIWDYTKLYENIHAKNSRANFPDLAGDPSGAPLPFPSNDPRIPLGH